MQGFSESDLGLQKHFFWTVFCLPPSPISDGCDVTLNGRTFCFSAQRKKCSFPVGLSFNSITLIIASVLMQFVKKNRWFLSSVFMQFDLILSKIICKISKLEVTSNHNSAVVRGMCQDKQIITSIKHLIFHRQRFQKFLEYFFYIFL